MGLIRNKSLDSILGAFNKTVKQLDALIAYEQTNINDRRAIANDLSDRISQLGDNNTASRVTIAKAATVKEKIAALIS